MNKIVHIIFIGLLGCKPKAENTNIVWANRDSVQTIQSVENVEPKTADHADRSIKSLDYAKAEIDVKDTVQFHLLKGECAVTIMPDTTWLRRYRESMPEQSWIEIISDHQYYESLATDTLELKGIPVFYGLNNKRFIKFQKRNNTVYAIDRTKMKDSWGIILFNGQDDSVIWFDSFIGETIYDIYKNVSKFPERQNTWRQSYQNALGN